VRITAASDPAPFVKTRADAPPGFFEVEAAGLRWLDVPGGVPVPQPLEFGPDRMLLPRLRAAGATPDAAEEFGRRLHLTHAAGAGGYGAPPAGWTGDGYIGDAPLPHPAEPLDRWGGFYSAYRVRPYVRAAVDAGQYGPAEAAVFDRVCARLEAGEFDHPDESASRIHGDLWSGNVIWCADGAWLVDPAAHGGHRETDLAMLAVFGLPYLDRVLDAYDEAANLAGNWRDRVGLHQLHPLLVHVVLFGGHYLADALAAARRYA
jgi:fructosamine-3-kinase